jgi:hypothetical protein
MSDPRDRALGMHRRITRRDFLNGARLAIAGSPLFAERGEGASSGAISVMSARSSKVR